MDLDEIRKRIDGQTKFVLVNSPQPYGRRCA
jgi:hypothetical protein